MKKLRFLPQFKPIKMLLGMIVSFVLILSYMVGCSDNDPIDDQPLPNPIADETPDPIVDENLITVDTDGGVFVLPSGIEVTIPQGAVTEEKEINIDDLNLTEVNALAPITNSESSTFLTAISIDTDGFDFSQPINIKIPFENNDENGLVVLYELQSEMNSWLFSDETIIVNNEDNFISIVLNESNAISGKGGQSNKDEKSKKLSLKSVKTDMFMEEDPCRKIEYKVSSLDLDYGTGEGCNATSVNQQITYTKCTPAQTGTFSGLGFSPLCKPQLIITPTGDIELEIYESQSIMLKTLIGSFPLSGQEITIVTNENLKITAPNIGTDSNTATIVTDSNGMVSFDVEGYEAGEGEVSLKVNFNYFLTTITAGDGEDSETSESDPISFQLDTIIKVNVKDYNLEIVSGDNQSIVTYSDNTGQPLTLTEPLKIKATDSDGEPLNNANVRFEVIGAGTVNNETVQTDANGFAETIWTIGNADEDQTVEVKIQKENGEFNENSRIEFKASHIDLSEIWNSIDVTTNCPSGIVGPYNITFNSNNTITFLNADFGTITHNYFNFNKTERTITVQINYTKSWSYECGGQDVNTVENSEIILNGIYNSLWVFTGNYTANITETPVNPCADNGTCSGTFQISKPL